MNQETKEKIYQTIQQDCSIEELKELKNYINSLLDETINFDNPIIEKNLELLTRPLSEFINDSYLISGVSKIISKRKNRGTPYVFDLIELRQKQVATMRGIGLRGYQEISDLLEKNNISLECQISKRDEEKLLQAIHKQSKSQRKGITK